MMRPPACLSCGGDLPKRRDAREVLTPGGWSGPFCAACAASARGKRFDQWLDEDWHGQRPP